MENIQIPPFYVGQEVVANCDHHQGAFEKGDEFKITYIGRSPCNCTWVVGIGISSSTDIWKCTTCTKRYPSKEEWLFRASRFSPKIEIGEFISMKQLVEQQFELISAN